MENIDSEIVSVECFEQNISIKYSNDEVENLPKNIDTYEKIYNTWIEPTPIFITDKHKDILRHISFAYIQKNPSSIRILDEFFNRENNDTVKAFFTYIRTRKQKIETDKAAWKEVPRS